MKTFGIWTVIFLVATISISVAFKNIDTDSIILLGLVFSHIMYTLIKDELNQK
jgi:hypothetical protein